ncbi:hypothetical protein N9O56_03305 [Rickettsiales bacterium]|nr:hypothetical protein [Rickettsiales bacterium]
MRPNIQQGHAARMSMENPAGDGASKSAGIAVGGDGGSLSTMMLINDGVDNYINNQGVKIPIGGDVNSTVTSREGVFETNIFETLDGSFLAPVRLNQNAVVPPLTDEGVKLEGLSGALGEVGRTITDGPAGGQRK